MNVASNLLARAGDRCELCGGRDALSVHVVASSAPRETDIVVCGVCAEQLAPGATLEPSRWRGLESAIWSEVPAVQVASHRLLGRLRDQSWARDLLEQVYLDGDVLAWASEPAAGTDDAADEERIVVKDSNGALLEGGDSVTLIKDLDVKGAGFTAKRGTLVKGIRLTDDPGLVEGRVNGIAIVLKTEFLKKS